MKKWRFVHVARGGGWRGGKVKDLYIIKSFMRPGGVGG